MTTESSLYDVLQVREEAEAEVIDAAYRSLCRKYHPDLNPTPDANERIREINGAYEVLGDGIRREAYDHFRRQRDRVRSTVLEAPPKPAGGAIEARPPVLDLRRSAANSVQRGTIQILNHGHEPLQGCATVDRPWLKVATTQTSDGIELMVIADVGSIPTEEEPDGHVIIRSSGGDTVVPVRIRAERPFPSLTVTPEILDFGVLRQRQVRSERVRVARLDDSRALDLRVVAHGDWLTVGEPQVRGGEATVVITADPERLAFDRTSDTNVGKLLLGLIEIHSQGEEQLVPVRAVLHRSWTPYGFASPNEEPLRAERRQLGDVASTG